MTCSLPNSQKGRQRLWMNLVNYTSFSQAIFVVAAIVVHVLYFTYFIAIVYSFFGCSIQFFPNWRWDWTLDRVFGQATFKQQYLYLYQSIRHSSMQQLARAIITGIFPVVLSQNKEGISKVLCKTKQKIWEVTAIFSYQAHQLPCYLARQPQLYLICGNFWGQPKAKGMQSEPGSFDWFSENSCTILKKACPHPTPALFGLKL